ncbi:tRNA pseudouridine(38-40) synthase TruA [Lactiplantibacillus mudanjiangensis]|uniref:tRNA pseudouridine synthase A n=1 Tax=Lactiplantibacillus mudanjiangensis TaxID=1296538 RepID=A0A660E2H1_9LACO|nr:tRNA pseudouridine(38-40) synthase TruA [Lactiplantibacillus mudanjiangensis]VDG23062.1 tRNA pseudouridine synthase A [Lactobacillus plantarum subsp. plantarum P-8] [Lactiplantibacillus mudanjiangensis]VDG29536.1 tRNA pseudouridine synthase A [Lactobacillus plantarum subsp. plantarum P-8] [Lactiplantibacillus mudanjiangensis]
MTTRYKITLTYDGTNFAGFQRQPHQRTVESVLTKAVNKMAKDPAEPIVIYGAGRTDAGVHAFGQVVHFDLPYAISAEGVRRGLNSLLPVDALVKTVEIVPDTFHARYDTVGKRYWYRAYSNEFVAPFKRNFTGHFKFAADINRIQQAIPDLVGKHDFSTFVASGSQAHDHVREIYSAKAWALPDEQEIQFEFCGSGFLYNQVRIMVAVLMEIGQGRRAVDCIPQLLAAKNRDLARGTAPAAGLYMKKVYYEAKDLQADLIKD